MFHTHSRLSQVLRHPVGNDVVAKILLQMNVPMGLVDNPLTGLLKLSALPRLARGQVDAAFIDDLVTFLNQHPDLPPAPSGPPEPAWWKEAVVYQIYPRTFCDSNGDGWGDLPGVLDKLDWLQELGVDVVWLSPVYDSPGEDNGYDIRNYQAILKEYGTMADFDRLLAALHARGMKLLMDLVINHTSDEHPWFQEALADPDSPRRNWYHLREGRLEDGPPNNWTSFFGGSAWRHFPEAATASGNGLWGLHVFSPKQMDLDWESESMRQEVYAMVRWWLDKGVDGFRLDVINEISKQPGLPEGSPQIGKLMGYIGIEHYFYGPRLHEHLRELREQTWAGRDVVAVGETPGPGLQMSRLLTASERGELDMVFNFDHLENPGKVRFDTYRYDLRFLARQWSRWQLGLGSNAWNSLYLENHDNPRMVSKVEPDPTQRVPVAQLLAVFQLTLQGTPFLFQGQELGMVNRRFTSIDEVNDIESRNKYAELLPLVGAEAALQALNSGSRDHGRVPLPWDETTNTVRETYRALIALRKAHRSLVYGRFVPVTKPGSEVFVYRREGGEVWTIVLNLTGERRSCPVGLSQWPVALATGEATGSAVLPPWGSVVYGPLTF